MVHKVYGCPIAWIDISEMNITGKLPQAGNFSEAFRSLWNEINRKHSEINIDNYDNVNAFVKKAMKTTTFKDFVFL